MTSDTRLSFPLSISVQLLPLPLSLSLSLCDREGRGGPISFTHTHTHTHTDTHAYTHTRTHTRTHIHTRTHTQTDVFISFKLLVQYLQPIYIFYIFDLILQLPDARGITWSRNRAWTQVQMQVCCARRTEISSATDDEDVAVCEGTNRTKQRRRGNECL